MDAKASLFPSAFDVKPPKGAEDWQSLYPYYTRFQPARRASTLASAISAVLRWA